MVALDSRDVKVSVRIGEILELHAGQRSACAELDSCKYYLPFVQLKPIAHPCSLKRCYNFLSRKIFGINHLVDAHVLHMRGIGGVHEVVSIYTGHSKARPEIFRHRAGYDIV